MSGNGTRLAALTQELSNRWRDTQEYWRDAKSEDFEKHYMQELMATVAQAVTIIDQLDRLLIKIKKDCE
jgi:hypothetical protein